jgi:phosphate transport system permease protein
MNTALHQKLKKQPRWHESLIQASLLACGAISIVTTIAIVIVLFTESFGFFARTQWQESRIEVALDYPASATKIQLVAKGDIIENGTLIRLGSEELRITKFTNGLAVVERAQNGTTAAALHAEQIVFLGRKVTLGEFFGGTEWQPQIGKFGIWALVNATLMTSIIAMLIALPLGLSAAIYLSEYASKKARNIIKPILEILAGIPTVVYGFFAFTFVTPLLRQLFGVDVVESLNTLSAGLVMGILIVPLVSSMSEDALSAVPDRLRQAAYGLGATKFETAIQVVVPAAISGLAAAFIVALSRALGETMIVALAAGGGPNFTFNPFKAAETMTGHIVRISSGDLSYQSIDYSSLFAIALLLFAMTLALNIISRQIVRRFQEKYD